MSSATQDLRYAFRMLARNPGFTAVAVMAVALGIGANTAMFTHVNAYLLRPLPFPGAGRLVLVNDVRQRQKRIVRGPQYREMAEWRRHSREFEDLAAYRGVFWNLTGADQPELVQGLAVSANFFRTLGVRPQIGRDFIAEEAVPGGGRSVVLSYSLWQKHFAGRDALGSTILLTGVPHTVVGIMPVDFRFPDSERRLWTPLRLGSSESSGVQVLGRLRSGASIASAAAELGSFIEGGGRVRIITLHEAVNHLRHARAPVLVLFAAVGFVLLIACANVANLMLGRAVARAKEIAIRTTMGATRMRIVRQVLTESLVLSAAGGALGLALGLVAVKVLLATTPAYMLPLGGMDPDRSVLLYTAAVSVLSGLLFGMAPAFHVSRARLNETLKEGGRSFSAAGRGWLRRALVVAEIAPALVLLIGAGLLLKSFAKMQSVQLGFRPENVMSTELLLPPAKYPRPTQRSTFIDQALENVARIPGVTAAGMVNGLEHGGRKAIAVEGQAASASRDRENFAGYRTASPEYFRAMGIPLRAGRAFTERDTAAAPRAVIVNESMAKRFWPGESPLGRMVRFTEGDTQDWMTVVGIAGDDRQSITGEVWAEMYAPYRQDPPIVATVVAHSAADAAGTASAIRTAIRAVDKDQPVANLRLMEERLADSVAPQRLTTLLLGAFAAVAFLLAVVGLYGVISYSVSQRTHEMGIRMALGAARGDLLRLIVGQGLVLAAIGIGIGLALAFGVTRLMSALLFGVSATDPFIFAAVPAALAVVAIMAAYIPAHRAAGLDPLAALRE